jgi:hypothetical protein
MSASEYQTGRFHDGEGWHTCMYRLGETRVHVTMLAPYGGIIHRSYPKAEARFIGKLDYEGGEYPLARMVKRYRKIAKNFGVTDNAQVELNRATQE